MSAFKFRSSYYELYQLLAIFAGEADNDIFDENIVLSEYLYGKPMLPYAKQALLEAEEVLRLEPFPEDLIGDLTNTISPIETRKEWLGKVVKLLREKIEELEDHSAEEKDSRGQLTGE